MRCAVTRNRKSGLTPPPLHSYRFREVSPGSLGPIGTPYECGVNYGDPSFNIIQNSPPNGAPFECGVKLRRPSFQSSSLRPQLELL